MKSILFVALALGLALWMAPSFITVTDLSPEDLGYFPVTQFGAVGDGTTNDTGPFTESIQAARPTHGVVWVGAGTYNVGVLPALNGASLKCASQSTTTIRFTSTVGITVVENPGSEISGCTLESSGTQPISLIRVLNAQNVTIEDDVFIGGSIQGQVGVPGQQGVEFSSSTGPNPFDEREVVADCRFWEVFTGVQFDGSGFTGWRSAGYNTIRDDHFNVPQHGAAIRVQGNGSGNPVDLYNTSIDIKANVNAGTAGTSLIYVSNYGKIQYSSITVHAEQTGGGANAHFFGTDGTGVIDNTNDIHTFAAFGTLSIGSL